VLMKLVRFLLFPFAILYDVITTIRNFLFDKGVLKATSFKIPVITVGNLSVGGTGKTPQIEYLARLLKTPQQIAILSRGYGRKSKGFIQIKPNDDCIKVGDEPLQYAKKFTDVIVAVDENRAHGITTLLSLKNPPKVVLLDDAYQHRKVKASTTILLTKYNDLYVDDFLLPTGNLRESRRGAKRADVIIVTKCSLDLKEATQQKITQKLNPKSYQKVFFTGISYANRLKGAKDILVKDLKKYEVLLLTGIANPKPLTQFLEEKNITFKHLAFPDHHYFTEKDIRKINDTFNTIITNHKIILTTEKDFVRLSDKIENLSYLAIETVFLGNQQKIFDPFIMEQI